MLAKSLVWVVKVEGWKERLAVVSGEGVVQEQERIYVSCLAMWSCNSWTQRWVMLCGDCGLVSRDQTAQSCQPRITGEGKRRILLCWWVPGQSSWHPEVPQGLLQSYSSRLDCEALILLAATGQLGFSASTESCVLEYWWSCLCRELQ